MATAGLLWLTPHLSPHFIITSSEKHLGFKWVNTLYTTTSLLRIQSLGSVSSPPFRWFSIISAPLALQPSAGMSVAWNCSANGKQPDQTIPDCSWSTDGLSEPERLQKRRNLKPPENSRGPILFFGLREGNRTKILSSTKAMTTYGMLCCASLVHSRNTWVLENNQTRLWHGDDDTAETLQNSAIFLMSPGIHWDVPKGPPKILCRSGFSPTVWSEIIWLNQSIPRDTQPCCWKSALKHLNMKTSDRLYPPNLLIWID